VGGWRAIVRNHGTIGVMTSTFRDIPGGVRRFLVYAFLVLALIGTGRDATSGVMHGSPKGR
jgi:hypothetical protein